MPYAKDSYTGDSSTTDFVISFPYIEASHVVVKVDGTTKTNPDDYTFTTDPQKIRFSTAPASGAIVLLVRSTSQTARLVNYQSGGVLSEEILDNDSLQAFYLTQEVWDISEEGSVAVGTTTTSAAGGSASVVNAGTSTNSILNFTIPRGPTGPTGPTGPISATFDTAAALKSSTEMLATVVTNGKTAIGDGGGGTFFRSTNLGVHGHATISGVGGLLPDGVFMVPLVDSAGNGSGGLAGVRVKSEIALEDGNGVPTLPADGDYVTIHVYDATASFAETSVTFEFDVASGGVTGGRTAVAVGSGGTTRENIIATIKNLRDAVEASALVTPTRYLVADRKDISSRKFGTFAASRENDGGTYTGMYHRLQLVAVPAGQTDTKGDVVRVIKSGTNIVVKNGEIGAAWIIQPGAGYTGTVTTSTDVATDWKSFHDHNETGGTQNAAITVNGSLAPSAGVITFDLADDCLYIRPTAGTYEYIRDYSGTLDVKWAGAVGDGVTDDSAAIQTAINSLLAGKGPMVERNSASATRSNGVLWLGERVYELGGNRIYANSGGNRHGAEANGFRIAGASNSGNPSVIRPDAQAPGSRLINGILAVGMPDCPNGNADYITRSFSMQDMSIVGGLELFAVQQSPSLFNVNITPSCPVGEVVSTIRTAGAGVVIYDASTASLDSSTIISGIQTVGLGTGTPGDGKRTLDGLHVINCNAFLATNCIISFHEFPIKFHSPDDEPASTTVVFNATLMESNKKTALIEKANQVDWQVQMVSSTSSEPYVVDAAVVVTGIAIGSTATVTTNTAHGYSNGDEVWLIDPTTNVDIDGVAIGTAGMHCLVSAVASTTFVLQDLNGDGITTTGSYSGSTATVQKLSTVYPRVQFGASGGGSVQNLIVRNCVCTGGVHTSDANFPDAGVCFELANVNDAVFFEDGNVFSRWSKAIAIMAGVTTADVVDIGAQVWEATANPLQLPGTGSSLHNMVNIYDAVVTTGRSPKTTDGAKSRRGWGVPMLTAEPTWKYNGLIVGADGTSWNPGSVGSPHIVFYTGSAWATLG